MSMPTNAHLGIDKDSSLDACHSQEGYMCQLAFQDHMNMLPRELFYTVGDSCIIQLQLRYRNILEASHGCVTWCCILDRLITA